MPFEIKKLGYSHNPWRLVDAESGNQIVSPETWDHPVNGTITTSEPVCGKTKDEVVRKALGLLEYAAKRLREKDAQVI